MTRFDPHSYADDAQPRVVHLDWLALVDFHTRTLSCEALLHLGELTSAETTLDLDTRGLVVESVEREDGGALEYALYPAETVLGARLEVRLPARVRALRVRYATSPEASALQWLEPPQTAGGTQPFLYSQCQAIHARSVIPVQDTPGRRVTYTAALTVPRPLKALMAAGAVGHETQGAWAVERFAMPQPIPPYLFAFAVGDLASRDLGPRSRVWAEPSVVEQAAWEVAETEQALATGEALFGPYDWERFDLLVLPPAFPYGGMENPRLTFVTPTVLAGDRSLTDVIAHELAHSWTGNLVTNQHAEHFWLNEGFTTYAERRIGEVMHGPEAAALAWALGRRSLERAVRQMEDDGKPQLTRLRMELAGADPDEAYSVIPYEKGALFLAALEQAAGRATWDRFIRAYIERHRFGTLTTEGFTAFVEQQLPGLLDRVNAHTWLYEPGIPADAPTFHSQRLARIEALGGAEPPDALARGWNATEWQIYLESVPQPAEPALLARLDERFTLTASGNYDVLEAWLTLALPVGYQPVITRAEAVLGSVGRMKYLKPIYRALAERPETRDLARILFERFEARYHPIARQVLRGLLEQANARG